MKVSIVVAVYNIEKYIKECIESILAQDFDSFEVIIIDDGSTDGSGEICDSFKKNKRVKVIHQKNQGLSAVRNLGVLKATSDYIAFIDGDDVIEPNYIAKLYTETQKNHADITVCGYTEFSEDQRADYLPQKQTLSGSDACWRLLTEQLDIDVLAWNKLYKRTLFLDNNITYPVGEKNEDNLTTYKLYSKAKIVSFIDESLYLYRKRKNSITDTISTKKRLTAKEKAAREAAVYFKNNKRLLDGAKIAEAWANINWINYALETGEGQLFDEKRAAYLGLAVQKIPGCPRKLKLYQILLTTGILYKIFRKLF